ncbi:MAG: hypothetical protein J4F33_03550 [Alphaproteobacteria bacterium]|nr:hypothetical protein [Alphaproteobacteria bacterium]
MRRRFSRALVVVDDRIACARCARPLADNGTPWKPAARLVESPVTGLGSERWVAGDAVVLRQFVCPGCGALLDSETALPGDPFLNDVLAG